MPSTTRRATLAPTTGTGVSLPREKDAVTGVVAVVVVPATQRTGEICTAVRGVATVAIADGRLTLPFASTARSW